MPLVFGRSIFGFAVVAGPPAPTWTDPDLANASYDSVSLDVSGQELTPTGLFFKSDGTKMYIVGIAGDDITQYALSTPWDVSTGSFETGKILDISSQATVVDGMFFKPDGTSAYVADSGTDAVYQYDLTTAWDVSTGSYASKSMDVSGEETTVKAIFFKPDGTKAYIAGSDSDKVHQYALTTAWDVSTGSKETGKEVSISGQETTVQEIFFSPNGDKLYIVGSANDTVYQYTLSTAWDVSTASYDSISFSVSTQESVPRGLFFKPDGAKMYIVGPNTDTVYQYSTVASAVTWTNPDLANASYDSVSFSVASQDTNPYGLTFKDDGTKFYMSGNDNNTVYQYAVSTAWDISTASFETGKTLDVTSQEITPHAVMFKSDGTSVYVMGLQSDSIFQYDLTTAWDISTASYASKSLSVSTQENSPRAFYFKDDGSKVYVVGTTNDTVYQYALSTAWDVSTGSFETGKSFSVASQSTTPTGLFLSPNGDKMYVLNFNTLAFQYSLSTAWDVSTASYDSVSFNGNSQDGFGNDIYFKSDGSKMYITGANTDTVYQYST